MDKKFLPLFVFGIIMATAAIIIANHFIKRSESEYASPGAAVEPAATAAGQPAENKEPAQAQEETESEPPETQGAPLLR